MSQTTTRPDDNRGGSDLETFLEERREALETVADGDYPFTEKAQTLLDKLDRGDI